MPLIPFASISVSQFIFPENTLYGMCVCFAVCQYSMLHYTAHARISHEITTSYIDIKTKISFRYWIELMVFIFVFINSIFDSGCFGLFWCIEKKDRQKFQLIAERKNPTLIHSMNLTTFSYHQPLYTPFGPFKDEKKNIFILMLLI